MEKQIDYMFIVSKYRNIKNVNVSTKLELIDTCNLFKRSLFTVEAILTGFSLLPPAYVVRREGNSFTLFVSSHLGGGVPIP